MENEKPVPPPLLWISAVSLTVFEDGLQGVLDRQDEAGGELLETVAGVHERGGVGEEKEPAHDVIELFLGLLSLPLPECCCS